MRICTEALSDIACAALVGALFNRLWLGSIAICDRQLQICIRACAAILLLNLPLQFLLLSASMTGGTSWADAWNAVPDVAATHSGRAMLMSICFAPCFLALSLVPDLLERMRNILTGLVLLVGFVACRALWGHAVSDGDFTLREVLQFLHLSSIAIWGGGILVAGLVTVPELASRLEPKDVERFGKRLSRTITIVLAIVILSGFYNSWKGLGGSFHPLTHSAWGGMLILKLCFVLIALGHGIRVRLLLKARDRWTQSQTTVMRRWVHAEGLVMLIVLVCSGWLANLPPTDM